MLRHTYAGRYLRCMNDLAGLQRLLGHADIRAARYVHFADDELHGRIERTIGGAAIAPTPISSERREGSEQTCIREARGEGASQPSRRFPGGGARPAGGAAS